MMGLRFMISEATEFLSTAKSTSATLLADWTGICFRRACMSSHVAEFNIFALDQD